MTPYFARANGRPVVVDFAGQRHSISDLEATLANLAAHERLLTQALRSVQDAQAARRAQLDQLRAMEADGERH